MPRSGLRAVHERALVPRQAAVRLAACARRRGATSTSCSTRSRPASPSTGARGCSTHYVRNRARHRDLYLSFVNFSFFGDEGDTFGNVLAVLCGLDRRRRLRIARCRRLMHAASTIRTRSAPSATRSSKRIRCGGRTCRAIGRTTRGSITTAASGRSSAASSSSRSRRPACASEAARGAREARRSQRARRLGVHRMAARAHARACAACAGSRGMPRRS